LQLGQGPDLPANWSLTLKLLRHPGQTTMIDMRRLSAGEQKGDSPHLCEAPFGPFRRAPT
jgi:hypothetical protein